MKIEWAENPLRTKVILDEKEKEIFRLKFKINELEDAIGSIKYYMDKDPNDVLKCPNPYMNGKTHFQLAKEAIPDIYGDNFDTKIYHNANYYLEALEECHSGDCTCVPASCSKCFAEDLLGINTIEGLKKHSAYKVDSAFGSIQNPVSIDEAIENLKNYEPKFNPNDKTGWKGKEDLFNSCIPRWKQEAQDAHDWLKKYRDEKLQKLFKSSKSDVMTNRYQKNASPFIKKHIDGLMIVFRDGRMRWLSVYERFLVFIGLENAHSLERKHWKDSSL